jgi:hypothetical protein
MCVLRSIPPDHSFFLAKRSNEL